MSAPKEETLEIRLESLEVSCQRQPQLMFKWGTQLAELNKKVKLAKNALKLCFAEIAKDVRARPGFYGLEKVTEGGIENAVLLHPGYQEKQQALVDAEYEQDVLDAFVKALADRKGELSNLTQLHAQMYWSRPVTNSKVPAVGTMRSAGEAVKPRKSKDSI